LQWTPVACWHWQVAIFPPTPQRKPHTKEKR
jgi:hypothetical protein